MSELRVPKFPVIVELAVEGAAPCAVEVYIGAQKDRAYARQRLLDLLEHPTQFFPGREVDADRWGVFNKETVIWVGIPLDSGALPVEEESQDEQLFDIRREVEVDLSSGVRKSGELLYSPPAERSRVSDFLNEEGRFFRLWTASHVFLVNKGYVLRVVERSGDSR